MLARAYIANLARWQRFALQDNVNAVEGAGHVDRDLQFAYVNAQASLTSTPGSALWPQAPLMSTACSCLSDVSRRVLQVGNMP